MKLRRLEVFVAVATRRSFTRAAHELCIAQSAVSVAVRELERELGTQLFVRGARSVALTEGGRRLLARAVPALRQLYAAADEIRGSQQPALGPLRIAAPAMVTKFALAQPLAAYLRRHPGLQIRVLQAGARQIEDLVLRGEVELGFIAQRDLKQDLECRGLWRFDNVACVPQASPLAGARSVSWREILKQPMAAFPAGYHQRALAEHYAEAYGLSLKIVVESESPEVLLEAVRAGCAVTTLPRPAVESAAGSVAALKLRGPIGDRLLVAACWRRNAPLSPAAEALLGHLAVPTATASVKVGPRAKR